MPYCPLLFLTNEATGNRYEELHDVAIEIIESQASPHVGTPTSPPLGYAFEDGFADRPVIGAGLGLEDATAAATLGGYLRIRAHSSTMEEKVIF
jgi:hypothetical protein